MDRDPRFPGAWWIVPGLAVAGLLWLALFTTLAHAQGLVDEIASAEATFEIPWHVSPVAERGKASWYGRTGHPTASGEKFPTSEMTCAHRSLPFGAIVRVTRVDNGRSIRCRVNDRGPFISGRIIDLSPTAAMGLGLIRSGTLHVKVEVLNIP